MLPLVSTLLEKLIPLYIWVAVGWWATRRLRLERETLAHLLIYVLLPLVIFQSVLKAPLSATRLLLPLLVFGLCSLHCALGYFWGGALFPTSRRYLFAFASGNANSGYFGFPVAYALFGEAGFQIAVLIALGFVLYENTLGFHMAARGHHSPREAFLRLLKLPSLYAFAAALMARAQGLESLGFFEEWALAARGAYSILGMMLIGMGLACAERHDWDTRFVGACLGMKFLGWPLAVTLVLGLLSMTSHDFDPQLTRSLRLMALYPMAGNVVAYATSLKLDPGRASIAVFSSTLLSFALILIASLTGWIA